MSEQDEDEDGAARAFAQLGREVSLLRAAVEGLAAARESIDIPDYEPTLERTEKILTALAQRIDPIAKSPLLSMTPDSMASQIATAAIGARREDARLVAEARAGLDNAAREIGNRLASARRGDEQNRWLYIVGCGGLVLGLLLYAMLAGSIARSTPDSWRWPERIATRVLDERGPWEAGQRLMQTAAPESWGLIVAASPLADGNRETVQDCREAAEKAKKPVRCTIEVKPPVVAQ
ncbi:hypothetical protein sphantq_04739 (plasmid) [Sphingobium sp. AntQ-1]|uniref:DUF6118 family protein n=1 Tax=Sphingobium sp. AntQ-1 TaxID=2930091 RepID=UPI00234F61A3|nr:DUF6118 family protein [Sphingobium sp. AntQ-1]WCP16243.1 hypothetical protein sphantq_04739 [Sphingobium sp. AntQ-1]